MKRTLQILFSLIALVTLVVALPVSTAAAADTGSIQINVTYGGRFIQGAGITIYQIGETTTVNGYLTFVPTRALTELCGYPASFPDLTIEANVKQLAIDAERLVRAYSFPNAGGGTRSTNAQGVVSWTNLAYGVYLVRQTGESGTAVQYERFEPFIVFLPVMNDEGNDWVQNITASPKTEPTPSPTATVTVTPVPAVGTINLRITKTWSDWENVDGIRPSSITISVFRKLVTATAYTDQDLYTTIVIPAPDGNPDTWTFTIYDLPDRDPTTYTRYDYLVREADVEGYAPTYGNVTGSNITNVHTTATPDPNLTPTPIPTITPVPTATPTPRPGIPVGVREIDGEWYYIDEFGVPLGLVPQTGDESNIVYYIIAILLLLSAAATLAVMLYRRRKQTA